ncbi:hypothetical protein, partial [Bacillus velezensis]
MNSPWLIEAAGAAGFRSRPGAGFLCSDQDGMPWLQLKEIPGRRSDRHRQKEHLKEKTPRVYGAIGRASAARRAMKSLRLIEAAGAARFRSRPGAGFLCSG